MWVSVSPDDAGWIVSRLYVDAHADAFEAAQIVEAALDGTVHSVALQAAHRDAILRHLEACPEGFAELRGFLLSDNHERLTPALAGQAQRYY